MVGILNAESRNKLRAVKLLRSFWYAIIPLFVLPFILHAQQEYPPLTNIISFEELTKKSLERNVEWTNPDGSKEKLVIKEMAIPFDQRMIDLTKEYIHAVYDLDSLWLDPKMIVFHAMGDGDLKTSLEISSFLHDQIPESWGNLSKAGKLPNGAHFIIDRDGTIICLSPPVSKEGSTSYSPANHRWYIKRHQDGNPVAIGIENVTQPGNFTDLTEAQILSNVKLAQWLFWFEHGKIKFMASHHQFNNEKDYNRFLNFFELSNAQKQFRTTGRKDIGEKSLMTILDGIQKNRIPVQLFFKK